VTSLLIAGSRSFTDYGQVLEEIERFVETLRCRGHTITEVLCGECHGPDRFGRAWAESNGIRVRSFPADWKRWGRSAGPIRNRQMVEKANAALAGKTVPLPEEV